MACHGGLVSEGREVLLIYNEQRYRVATLFVDEKMRRALDNQPTGVNRCKENKFVSIDRGFYEILAKQILLLKYLWTLSLSSPKHLAWQSTTVNKSDLKAL